MLYGLKSSFIPATAKGVWGARGVIRGKHIEPTKQCSRGDITLLIPWINEVAMPGFLQADTDNLGFTCYLESGVFHFDAERRGNYCYMTAYYMEHSHDQIIP